MKCDECQNRICEWTDRVQNDRADPITEQHLTSCPACRKFRETWQFLDAQLTSRSATTAVPADFKATLFARLPGALPRLTPTEIASRREQYESEYREATAALLGRDLVPDPATLRRPLMIAGACAVAGVLVSQAIRGLPIAVATVAGRDAAGGAMLLICCAIGLSATLFGLRHTSFWRFGRIRVVSGSIGVS